MYLHTQVHVKLSWVKGSLNYRIRTEKHHSLCIFKVGLVCSLEGKNRVGHLYISREDQMGKKSESTMEVMVEMVKSGNIQNVLKKLV